MENLEKESVNLEGVHKRIDKSVHEKLNELKLEEINKKRLRKDVKGVFNKKISYAKLAKSKVYFFFVCPTGYVGFMYRLFTFTIISVSILIGCWCTVQKFDDNSFKAMFYFELFATCYFYIEFILRLWSSSQNPKFAFTSGKLRFLSMPTNLIELAILIVNSVLLYFFYSLGINNCAHIHSLIRICQILRYLHVDRDAQAWTMLFKVIVKHKSELLTTIYFAVFIMLLSAYLVLLFEKPYSEANDDNHFLSYGDALYWAIITMTTIGFGDRSPRTFYGKLISTSLCIVGVAFWTLPGGIIGSGFALQVEKRNKKKKFNRLVPSAATLIQSWWRMKSTLVLTPQRTSCLVATVTAFDVSKPLSNNKVRSSPISTLKSFHTYHALTDKANFDLIVDDSNEVLLRDDSGRRSSILMRLSPEHLITIRLVLLLKYFSALNKFKSAYKPYDFREDLVEQYTRGNLDIMLKLKELQKKLDQSTERAPSSGKYSHESANNEPMEHKLNQIKNQINDLSTKLDLFIKRTE